MFTARTACCWREHDLGALRLFARGSGFNEARSNGTPYQTNGTRLWRYCDWRGLARPARGSLVARLYGSTEHFRQTFSSISNLPDFGDSNLFLSLRRNSKQVLAHAGQRAWRGCALEPAAGRWAAAGSRRGYARRARVGSGADLWINGGADQFARSSARLRRLCGSHVGAQGVDADRRRAAWTGFRISMGTSCFGTAQAGARIPRSPRNSTRHFFDPRLGLSRKLSQHWALSASGFRAFREPTPNELYRSTQVGNQLTKPNSSLLSERATGWETGLATRVSLGQRAHQLLSHAGQSAHHCGHYQSQLIADSAHAREPRPD